MDRKSERVVSDALTQVRLALRNCALVGIAVAWGSLGTIPCGAAPLDTWYWRNPQPGLNSLLSVTCGEGRFVAVGLLGAVSTSTDGIHWTSESSLTNFPGNIIAAYALNSVAYGAGTFVAVGDTGTIFSSEDGTNWTHRESGTQDTLEAAAYANGIFVVMGRGGLLTSPNGRDWNRRGTATWGGTHSITYGVSSWVWVTDSGWIYSSTNLTDWTGTGEFGNLSGVAYGNGTFVAVNTLGGIWTSPDGVNWTLRRQAQSTQGYLLTGVTYANGVFVAVGNDGSIEISTDGVTWDAHLRLAKHPLNAITYGDGIFAAVGDFGVVVSTDDLAIWPLRNAGPLKTLWAVTYGGGKFVAVGDAGTIASSVNGSEWAVSDSGSSSRLGGVAYGGGLFLAVGDGGTILTSPDAVSWTVCDSGTTNNLYAATWGDDLFVAVGSSGTPSGTVMTSTDGISWKAQQLFACCLGDFAITSIGYGDGVFVGGRVGGDLVFGDSGGTRWWFDTPGQSLLDVRGLYGAAYGNGRFEVVGAASGGDFGSGIVLASTPDFFWNRVDTAAPLRAVAFGRDRFVSVGPVCSGWWCFQPQVVSSTNGTNWTYHDARAATSLHAVAYGRGTFVAVGEYGTILQSDKIGPRLQFLSVSGPNSYSFNLIGDAGESYQVESSGDLVNWIAVTNFVSVNGTNQLTDSTGANFNRRFYRALTP